MSPDRSDTPTAFISYAHEDRAVASEIAFGLQKRGCEVWIDQGELSVGDSLIERLAEAIHEVDFMIPLISPHSTDSPWCRRELSLAVTREIDLERRFGIRRVLPLRLGSAEMPPMLRDKFYLEVGYDSPGDIVPRLWEDIGKHVATAIENLGADPPNGAEAAYRRGRNLYDKGEVTSARRYLNDAAQRDHPGAALLLGEILYDQGEFENAAREWEFVANGDDRELANAALIQYGRLLAQMDGSGPSMLGSTRGPLLGGHNPAEADRMWRQAAESGHHDAAWAWIGLGRLWEDRTEPDVASDPVVAEEAFERAAHGGHAESHDYALYRLGRVKRSLGKRDEAIAIFGVVATGSDREWGPVCAFDLGRAHWDAGDEADAAYWWHQAANADHPRISAAAREALDDPNSIWRLR